jgi:SAM-dependent methyltransferase
MSEIEAIYAHRFSEQERAAKAGVWRVLCHDFFGRYVRPQDTVLDLGAGFCEFINHIGCAVRIAVDLSEETAGYAAAGVVVYRSADLSPVPAGSVDLVFCSNFFEHLPSKTALGATLDDIARVLKPAGRLMILGPNIKYLYADYWDFIDHHIPLSHVSMVEALVAHGYVPTVVIPRFMPFTTKSALPKGGLFVKLYLKLPLAWRIMGRQMFVLAERQGPGRPAGGEGGQA